MTTIIAAISRAATYAMPYSMASYPCRRRFRLAGGEELHHLVVVLHAAGLFHALLHARQAGRARAGDEALGGLLRLRDGLDAPLFELRPFLLPQLLQRPQAFALVLDGDALQGL